MTTGNTTRPAPRALKFDGLPPPLIVNMSQPLTPSPTNHVPLVPVPSPTPPYSPPEEIFHRRPHLPTHNSLPVLGHRPSSVTFSPRQLPPSSPAVPAPSFQSSVSSQHSPLHPHSFSSDTYLSPNIDTASHPASAEHSRSPPWEEAEQDIDAADLETKFTDMRTSSPNKSSPLKPAHTPRPPNAWILYRSEKLRAIAAGETLPGMGAVLAEMGISSSSAGSEDSTVEDSHKKFKKAKGKKGSKEPTEGMLALGKGKAGRGLPQADISKMISLLWKRESREVRGIYERLSEAKKAEHQEKYPGYKFQPLRKADKIKMREEREREKEAAKREKESIRSGGSGRARRARTNTRVSPSSPYSVIPPGSMTRPPLPMARSLSFSGQPQVHNTATQSVFWAGVGGTTYPHKTTDVPPPVGPDHPQRAYPFPIPPGALPSMSAEDHANNPFSDETWIGPVSSQVSADRRQSQQESRPSRDSQDQSRMAESREGTTAEAGQQVYEPAPVSTSHTGFVGYQQPLAQGYYPVVPFIYEAIPLSPGQVEGDFTSSSAGSPNKIASEWLSEQTAGISGAQHSESSGLPHEAGQPQAFQHQQYIPAQMLQHYPMQVPQPMWMYDPSQPSPATGTAGFVTLFNPHNGDLRVLECEGGDTAVASGSGYSMAGLQDYETLQVQMTEDSGPFLSAQALSPDSWSGNTPTTSTFPRTASGGFSTNANAASSGSASIPTSASSVHPPRHVSQSAYPSHRDDGAIMWMPPDRTLSFSNLMGMGLEMGGILPTLGEDDLLNWEAGDGMSATPTALAAGMATADPNSATTVATHGTPITPVTGTGETRSSRPPPSATRGSKRGRIVARRWDS